MVENKKKEIMLQNRHQFIHGADSKEREFFLTSLEKDYQIKIDETFPMAIYMDEFSLPNVIQTNNNIDISILKMISCEYLNFSIAYNILNKISKIHELNNLNNRVEKLLNTINRIDLNDNFSEITSIDELIKTLKESRNFYSMYYSEYITGKLKSLDINDLKIQFLTISSFLKVIKEMLNNNSYFGIIIDKKGDIPLISKNAINSLINKRINGDLSIKVACRRNDWNTYIDLNGDFIEYVHDYDIIELENSIFKHIKVR